MKTKKVSLHALFSGSLLVKIKGVGEKKIDTGGQSLLSYVLDAYGILHPTVITREPGQDLTKDWRVIRFSSKDRVLEVKKIG